MTTEQFWLTVLAVVLGNMVFRVVDALRQDYDDDDDEPDAFV